MTCLKNLENIPISVRYILTCFNVITGIVATCGNSFIFYLFINNRGLRTITNYYLMSLAATDLLVGVALEPIFVAQLLSADQAKNCELNATRRFFTALLTGASMGTIAVISYDRLLHISKTVNYNDYMGKAKVVLFISMSWILPLVCTFFKYIGKNELVYSISIFVYSLITAVVIAVCYLKIKRIIAYMTMERLTETAQDAQNKEITDQRTPRRSEVRRSDRAVKAIKIIIICFFIFVAPIFIYHGVAAISSVNQGRSTASQSTIAMTVFYAIAMTISMVNSAANPFIYYYRMPEFTKAANRVLRFSRNSITAPKDNRNKDGRKQAADS